MKVPRHVAIIMDGNRRWAEARGLPVIKGHEAGVEAVKRTLDACQLLGIEYLTLYAFSAENWKRPAYEINGLMRLLEVFINRNIDEIHEKGVRLRAIGRLEKLPSRPRKLLFEAIEKTKNNEKGNLTLAISYGGRSEIVDAAKRIAYLAAYGKINPSDVNEEFFAKFLYAPDIPDPELLIRTSGEMIVSNFLLWQISYSEIYVANVLWPDFLKSDLEDALKSYLLRERRFGKR
jgi:undecaprenyl diphosphate synthase